MTSGPSLPIRARQERKKPFVASCLGLRAAAHGSPRPLLGRPTVAHSMTRVPTQQMASPSGLGIYRFS